MGLLAKATLRREEMIASGELPGEVTLSTEKVETAETVTAPKLSTFVAPEMSVRPKASLMRKLKKVVAGLALGLTLPTLAPRTLHTRKMVTDENLTVKTAVARYHSKEYAVKLAGVRKRQKAEKIKALEQRQLTPEQEAERDMLARLFYGEAGRGADGMEVLHTVYNRVASKDFPNTVAAVVTQPNQFVGYKETHPVLPEIRKQVDIVANEFEANGHAGFCNHLYFRTGKKGICNKFEISPDGSGKWVPFAQKQYEPMEQYCPAANAQYAYYQSAKNTIALGK